MMTPQQALSMLYRASRLAPLPADQHDQLRAAAGTLEAAITPKAKRTKAAKKATTTKEQ